MKIRRFYSKNMRSALRQINEEFGEDAAILSSQKTSTGVEVIAALDYDQELLPESLKRISESRQTNKVPTVAEDSLTIGSPKRPINSNEEIAKRTPVTRETDNRTSASFAGLVDNQSSNLPQKETSKVASLQWSTDPGLAAMKEELSLMRTMMSEQFKGISWERYVETEPTKAMLARRFTSLGVSRPILATLLPKVASQQDAECSWQNLLALFAKKITTNCQNILEDGGIFAFMGPTGAGKTTTIAKIAARFVIKHGVDSVALISTDNYRISAQQQLTNFSRILGVPMASVSSKKSLDDLLDQFRSKKLVLIDTAGMSVKDTEILEQLESIKNSTKGIKRFLLMPATNQLAVLRQSIELFRRFSPYSVIISKLDEAASLGEVLSLLVENNLPVAFTTDGQKVPEDIRIAKSHHLVSKAVWLTDKFGTNPEDWKLAQEQPQKKYG